MGTTSIESAVEKDAAIDSLARSLHRRLPRRRVAGLLATALAAGVFGISSHATTVEARRKRGKRRNSRRSEAQAEKGTPIGPNCIYVCCDGTCDSWTMCLKCVKWPKETSTVAIASE